MRIASGDTSRKIAFVAVDATDFTTRETGLSSFTVYRSRDGGTATAYTTPTISELSAGNMPGVYVLTVDEDTTISSGVDSEEIVLHITHAGMAPVTRTIELYRPKITAGNTLGVAADGDISGNVDGSVASVTGAVGSVTGNVGGNVTGSVGSISGVTFPTNFADLAITATNGLVSVGTNNDKTGYSISGTLTTLDALDTAQDVQHTQTQADIAALNDLSAAEVNAQVDSALLDYDGPTKAEMDAGFAALNDPTVGAIADAVWTEAIADHSGTAGSTAEALDGATAPTAAAVADAVWEEAIADHSGTAGSTAEALNAAGAAGDPWTTALPGAYGAGSAGYIIGNNLDAPVSTVDTVVDGIKAVTDNLPNSGALTDLATAAALATVDTNVDAILVDTGTTIPAQISALNDLDAAGIRAAVGLATANLDTQIGTLATAAALAVVDANVDAVLVDTNELQTDWANGGRLDLLVDAILEDTGTTIPGLIAALNDLSAADILTTALTESYSADGAAPTLSQAIFLILQFLYERATSGTTVTVNKLDGATPAATLTLDDSTTPTSITRAT